MSYAEYLEFAGKCDAIKQSITNDISYYKRAVGDVATSYRRVILDKCFQLASVQGKFYYKQMEECVRLQNLVEGATPQMTEEEWATLLSNISSAQ
jgi:hypothetical protein